MFKGLFICGVLRFVAGWRTFVLFSYICLYCSVLLEFFPSQISVVPTFFISLDIVFHEQDLCSCVLHVVYHGVQEMSS